jgi:hypothetical protein
MTGEGGGLRLLLLMQLSGMLGLSLLLLQNEGCPHHSNKNTL